MRNFGDPIPHMPPIPSIPDVVDDFYHVGFGSAIGSYEKDVHPFFEP